MSDGEERQARPKRLGPLDFRKSVQWFLAALVGFLVFMIVFLLLFLQGVMAEAAAERQAQLTRSAAWIEQELRRAPDASAGLVEGVLDRFRVAFQIAAIELDRGDGTTVRSGTIPEGVEPVVRRLGEQELRLWVGEDPLAATSTRFTRIAIIVLSATVLGTILLLLFLPRVTKPVEIMLADATELEARSENVSDERFLIDTFRSSIARLREQELELRELHEREKARADDLERVSRMLTRSITSGFVSLDASGNVVEVNEAARRILAIPAHELPAPLEKVFSPGLFTATLRESLESAQAVARKEISEDGSDVQIGLTTVPLRGESDELVGMIALFTDLSEIRELEARVRDLRVLADLGEVAAGIAHEFRNSLGTILGYLKMALRGGLDEDLERKVRLAETEGQRMAATIRALLGFARPMEVDPEPVAFAPLVERTVKRIDAERFDLSRVEPAQVAGDPALLETLVENLARNALEADSVGPIDVRVSRGDAAATLEIRDRGSGIPDHMMPRLFLPFQTGKREGTGLGLAIARKIALSHGGTIELVNREVGASALVTLPLHEKAP